MIQKNQATMSKISINNEQHTENNTSSPSSQDWSRLAICKMFKEIRLLEENEQIWKKTSRKESVKLKKLNGLKQTQIKRKSVS